MNEHTKILNQFGKDLDKGVDVASASALAIDKMLIQGYILKRGQQGPLKEIQ